MARNLRSAINSSASHVFEILRLVAKSAEPLGVSEISRRLGLPVSTVYRALVTLEESDYIVRYQNMPRYELGPMPQLLNRAMLHRYRLHAASRPFLRALAESTGETATITVRLGWYGLRLAGIYGSRDIYHRDRLGEISLLHRSLPGRGVLAFLAEAELAAYRAFVASHHADDGEQDWGGLTGLLEQARLTGFEHEDLATGERRRAVAMPVRDAQGEVIAAIAISGPIYDPDQGGHHPDWLAARDALEAEIANDPGAFVSPFARLAPDAIVIRLEPATPSSIPPATSEKDLPVSKA